MASALLVVATSALVLVCVVALAGVVVVALAVQLRAVRVRVPYPQQARVYIYCPSNSIGSFAFTVRNARGLPTTPFPLSSDCCRKDELAASRSSQNSSYN